MRDAFLIVVDGGQTSTRAALARGDGTVIGFECSGPQGHLSIDGEAHMRRSLVPLLTALSARLPAGSIGSAVLGLTSIDDDDPAVRVLEGIVRETIRPRSVQVMPDRVVCLTGATGGGPGVVLIAGGGTIGYGVDEQGRKAVAGGYGTRLAEGGSATDIGRAAVLAAARAGEGRGQDTRLEKLVKDRFELAQLRDIIPVVYAAGFSMERFASLAPAVLALADEGDEVACRIAAAAVSDLSGTACAVLTQLYGGPQAAAAHGAPPAVSLVGGLFNAARVRDGVRRGTQAGWPGIEVTWAPNAPLLGALIHAGQAIGTAIDAAWVRRAETGLRAWAVRVPTGSPGE